MDTAIVSFLMREGCMEREVQVLQVKEEDKIVQREKKKQLCLFAVRGVAGKADHCVLEQWVFPVSSCHGPP